MHFSSNFRSKLDLKIPPKSDFLKWISRRSQMVSSMIASRSSECVKKYKLRSDLGSIFSKTAWWISKKHITKNMEIKILQWFLAVQNSSIGSQVPQPTCYWKWVGGTNPSRADNFSSEAPSTENVAGTPPHVTHIWIQRDVRTNVSLQKLAQVNLEES